MIGANVPTIGGISKGFYWAKEWGCECIQIYVTLSRRWDVSDLSSEEILKFKSAWQGSPVKKVVAHVPYLVNLASPDENLWKKSINRLSIELSRAQQLGVAFLILHPGSYGNSSIKEGIKRIIDGLNFVLNKTKNLTTKILLETMSGQGTTIGSNFEEIAYILKGVKKTKSLGVCFDTAHVFIAGYDIRKYETILKEFNKIIGLGKIKAFHLNDAKTKLGSRNDRHACIGEGELGLQVFRAIMNDSRFLNVPKILEIPERDKKSKSNLELLRSLISIKKTLI